MCVIDGLCPISKQKVFVSEVSLVPAGLYMFVYICIKCIIHVYYYVIHVDFDHVR